MTADFNKTWQQNIVVWDEYILVHMYWYRGANFPSPSPSVVMDLQLWTKEHFFLYTLPVRLIFHLPHFSHSKDDTYFTVDCSLPKYITCAVTVANDAYCLWFYLHHCSGVPAAFNFIYLPCLQKTLPDGNKPCV